MMLIYIGGMDGCGKTTQARLLVESLNRLGFRCEYRWIRWEPSYGLIMNRLRKSSGGPRNGGGGYTRIEDSEYLRRKRYKRAFLSVGLFRRLWWFYACHDYYLRSRRCFDGLDNAFIVADRYLGDFLIDQAINFNLSPGELRVLSEDVFLRRFSVPNLSIILDVPFMIGYSRKRDGTSAAYLGEREKYYKSLATIYDGAIIDASEDTMIVAGHIMEHVKKRFF